jgi:heptosyltransferase-3
VKTALIVPYRYLGDTLLAVPLARSAQAAGYRVAWLVHSGSESLLEGQSFADAVHVLTADNTAVIARTLYQSCDIALVVNGTDRLTGLARLAARRVYVTLTKDRFADAWKRLLCTAWQPFTAATHTMDYVQGLQQLAALPAQWQAGLEWNHDDEQRALQQAHVLGKPYIHIHPFARVAYKYWPDHCWQALLGMMLSYGFDVVVTGSPQDQQKAEGCFSAYIEHPRLHLCCGSLNWRELSALSAQSAAYIGVDTANTHLAAGSGAKTIALFGPTDPRLWGPWPTAYHDATPWQAASSDGVQRQGNVVLVQGVRDCVPCQAEGCDNTQHSACLNEAIPAARVWALCLEKINE